MYRNTEQNMQRNTEQKKKHRKLSKMLTETEYICKEILNGKEDERRT